MGILYHNTSEKSSDIMKTIEKRLVKSVSSAGFDGFRLFQFQSFEIRLRRNFVSQADFLFRQQFCFRLVPGPSETSVVKSFIQQKKPVSLPKQRFDAVSPSSAEQKQCRSSSGISTVWIKRQFSLYDFCQSVDSSAKIGISGYQIYLNLWIGCKISFSMISRQTERL